MEKDNFHSVIPPSTSKDNQRIQELGYNPALRRKLSLTHLLGLTMANVAPSASVVLVGTTVFAIGGTFTISSCLIVGFVIVLIMLCLAELTSVYPLTGGIYSLAYKVLPGPMMWICLLSILVSYYVGMAYIILTCFNNSEFKI